MRFSVILLAATICLADVGVAQRSNRRVGSGGSRGYYSSFGRSSSGRRWNNGELNNINAPGYKGIGAAHAVLGTSHYVATQYTGPYRYTEEEHGPKLRQGTQPDYSETEQITETVTEGIPTTDSTATADSTEPTVTEGPLMKRLRPSSGPHIVRDSWCRVSESKDCVPAL